MSKRRRSKLAFANVPDWCIDPEKKDASALASALSLAGLEGKWVRLDAETQRKILGYPVFGKRMLHSDGVDLRTSYSAAFGTDSVVEIWPWRVVTEAARAKKSLWHA